MYNDTPELFITSDNPSCFDYIYGSALCAARFLPVTPRQAFWTNLQAPNIPKLHVAHGNMHPAGRTATPRFVRDLNILVVQSAENLMLSSVRKAYIPICVQKNRSWLVCSTGTNIKLPAEEDHHCTLTQTRACPKNRAVP